MKTLYVASVFATASALSWGGAPTAAMATPAPWSASAIYANPGAQVSENGLVYRNNWWTQGQDPATNNGPYPGSGQPWTLVSASACSAAPPTPTALTASGTTRSSTTLSWTPATASNCTIGGYQVYKNGAAIGTVAGPSVAISSLSPATAYTFSVAALDSFGASAQTKPITVTTASAGGTAGRSSQSAGSIHFHLLLGVGTAQDSLTLAGGNFDDLIMSNIVAGVMFSHLVEEGYPGIQFNKDYLIGSIFGQLLQENLETQVYQSSTNLIDPSPDQQAVMGAGQGGPYQINNYAVDLVSGTYAPPGHSLINYIAIQKNIGYTMDTAAAQFNKPTPASFNNKYYGPILPAFFHYNDMVALSVTGKGANPYLTPWQPYYDEALTNFINIPDSFLDVLLNVAYNQGYYGTLVPKYSNLGATATSATVASVNAYNSVWGNGDTYSQYPYQVRYSIDQLYDNPIPTTNLSTIATPNNHVAITMATLEGVFSHTMQTLAYSNGTAPAHFFTDAQATAAFSSALMQNQVSSSASLDLSNAASRARIFAVIDAALSNLEASVGMKFNATTAAQL